MTEQYGTPGPRPVGRADLHVHTTCSDGTLTPPEVVRAAADLGLAAVGITDHDTTVGVAEALAMSASTGTAVVPGVEINTEDVAFEVHILGYYIDLGSERLQGLLRRLRRGRIERAKEILRRLDRLGIRIDFDELAHREDTRALGRPHIARVLYERGHAPTTNAAFRRFLKKGSPAFVERYRITPEEATSAIVAAGGVAVFAHPGLLGRDSTLRALMDVGLAGIEVYHPEHTEDKVRKYEAMARDLSLIATGGSDSHGTKSMRTVEIGEATCDAGVVDQLRGRSTAA